MLDDEINKANIQYIHIIIKERVHSSYSTV